MGKKKDKQRRKHGGGHDGGQAHAAGDGRIPAPLAGLAAMVTAQLQSPATRALMATGLRAAADALTRSAVPPSPPTPASPTPPQPAAAPVPPVPPVPPQGTTKAPDPQAIAGAIGEAAEAVLARFFGAKK
jgi:hypothetical protein